MDQHPIPQDVTGFQFKLIGSMTVKQFGYIAGGVIMAVLIYYTPKIHILAKTLLIPGFGIGGVIVAFVPIEGRPVDVMAKNFFKAVFSPNQYAYKRSGRKMSFSHIADAKAAEAKAALEAAKKTAKNPTAKTDPHSHKEEQLRKLLLNSHANTKSDLDTKENAFLNSITTVAAPIHATPPPAVSPLTHAGIPQQPSPLLDKIRPATPTITPISHVSPITPTAQSAQLHPSQPTQTTPLTTPTSLTPPPQTATLSFDQKRDDELQQKEEALEKELIAARQADASPTTSPANEAHQKVTALETQIQEVHQQKQQLEEEIAKLKNQLASQTTTTPLTPHISPTSPPIAPPTPTRQDAEHVRSVPQAMTPSVGLPHVSDTPNVVVGIVKDPRGNVLPNILIEVKDKDNNPVRAFKTSPLGQFASATALPEGTYTIILEDPKKTQTFDTVQIIANNQIMLPIEIISHDAREELRKQLFN